MERTPRSYKVQSKTWIDRIEAILLSYGRRIPVDALHALNSRFLPPRLQKFVRLLHSKEHLTRELLPTDERKRMVGDLVALLSDLSSRPSSAEEEEGKGEEDYINSEEEDFTAVGDILPKTFDVRHWERRLIHDAGVSRMLELASIETQERERSGYDYEKEGIEEVAGSVTTYRSLNRNRHLSWEKIPSNDSVPVHSTPVKKEEDEEDSLEEPPAEDKRPPSGDLYLRDPPKALIDLLTQIMAGEERSSPAPSQSSSSYIPLYKKERQERVSKGDEEKVEHQQWLHRVAQRMIATASSSATADLTFEEDLTDEKKVDLMVLSLGRNLESITHIILQLVEKFITPFAEGIREDIENSFVKRGNTASILGPLKAEVLDEVEKKKWKEQAAKRRRKTIHELRRKCAPREGLLRPHPSIERTQSQKNSDERKACEKKVRGQKRKLEKKHNVYNWRHVLATLKNREELQDEPSVFLNSHLSSSVINRIEARLKNIYQETSKPEEDGVVGKLKSDRNEKGSADETLKY